MKGRVMTATQGAQHRSQLPLQTGSVPGGHSAVMNGCRLFSDSLEPLVRDTHWKHSSGFTATPHYLRKLILCTTDRPCGYQEILKAITAGIQDSLQKKSSNRSCFA